MATSIAPTCNGCALGWNGDMSRARWLWKRLVDGFDLMPPFHDDVGNITRMLLYTMFGAVPDLFFSGNHVHLEDPEIRVIRGMARFVRKFTLEKSLRQEFVKIETCPVHGGPEIAAHADEVLAYIHSL